MLHAFGLGADIVKKRLAGTSVHARNPAIRWGRCTLNIIWLLGIFGLFLIGAASHPRTPLIINQAFSSGVERVTLHHLTPGPALEWIILVLVLISVRWVVLEYLAVWGSRIEVRPIDNASGQQLDTHRLDVAFREYMTLPKLYQLTTIPGDPEPEHLVEVLKVPSTSGWRGLLAATISYAFPRRSFIVSAALRFQDHEPMYGVAIQVRRLPGLAIELETQWSTNFERALQRGAYAAVAHILPQTRACANAPWSSWRGRVMPVTLFRDYQRAKKMVAERRYDEALSLYHRALIVDANNIDIRYDIGQLYERLGLHSDALLTYLDLIDQLFPVELQKRWPHVRRHIKGKRDSFVIWYRCVIVLALGAPLARELLRPDWSELREWIAIDQQEANERPRKRTISSTLLQTPFTRSDWYIKRHHAAHVEMRPLRTVQLLEMRRLLAENLKERYSSIIDSSHFEILMDRLLTCDDSEERIIELQRCLLKCAELEARRLERSLKWSIARYLGLRASASLTLTTVRQAQLTIRYRLALMEKKPPAHEVDSWTHERIQAELEKIGYKPKYSTNWLEHYNAACIYALVMAEDKHEIPSHLPYAYEAVSALELALRYGEDVDFLRTKRYWLQAGDPDLAGLRRYKCFRAFEARVYGRPLPATVSIAKYELYLHLRALIQDSAGHVEREWRRRAEITAGKLTHGRFEEWWRQEQNAWELAIRLGRFYRQWQTRREAVESRRNWIEYLGREVRSVSYPNINDPVYVTNIGDFTITQHVMDQTEIIFEYLGYGCGLLTNGRNVHASNIMDKTRDWSKYAARCAQAVPEGNLLRKEVIQACEARAAVWSALRQWAENPDSEHRARFAAAVRELRKPPRLRRSGRNVRLVPDGLPPPRTGV